MALLIKNAMFSILEQQPTTTGKMYLITIHPADSFDQALTELLMSSLNIICGAIDSKHTIIIDTSSVTNGCDLAKNLFAYNFDKFRNIDNTGIYRFIIVTTSKVVTFTSTIFKTICGSQDLVFSCATLSEAMLIANQK